MKARAARENWIDSELRYGSVPDWVSPHGNGSMFAADEERRAAWEERREALMENYADRGAPGHRPWGWWHFVAERPPYVISYADYKDSCEARSIETQADLYDQYVTEPLLFLASIGELRDDELATLEAKADEARPRIGTDDEQIGSGGVDRADRRRVRLFEAVRRAAAGGS